MEKLVATVFKVLGLSTLLLVLYTMSSILIDVYVMTSNVTSTAILLQSEIARHNGLPTQEVAELFARRLCDDVLKNNSMFTGVVSNLGDESVSATIEHEYGAEKAKFGEELVEGGKKYESIKPEESRKYGDTIDLAIKVKYNALTMVGSDTINNIGVEKAGESAVVFKYMIPCLYFNK